MFGFRLAGGFLYAVAFAALVLTLTLAVSLGADATGVGIAGAGVAGAEMGSSGGASQLLLVPQLLLVTLSTGMAPADAFPDWLHPVRALPACLTGDRNPARARHRPCRRPAIWRTSVAWCLGLLVVFGALAVRMQKRTQ